jgi:cation diffusion facilitator family transporter
MDNMHKTNLNATIIGLVMNVFLFVIKLIAGLMSNSLALISDAINSLTDIISSVAIFFAVKISNKEADEGHPFGHYRFQPLAAFVVAIFTGIFGFEILKMGIEGFFSKNILIITWITFLVPIITIISKFFMWIYFNIEYKKSKSPAIKAMAIDARNDVFVGLIVFIAIMGSWLNVLYLDNLTAIIISIFIFKSGYDLATENMDYLLGKSAPKEMLTRIKNIVKNVKGVKGFNDVNAHYVENIIHIEIHIEVDKKISTEKSHSISKNVQRNIESLEGISKAFIHVDPV